MKNIHSEPYKRFLRRLRNARLTAGKTQTEVARALNKPQSFVSKIERGERRLDPLELKELTDLYQVNLSSFFETTIPSKKAMQDTLPRSRTSRKRTKR